MNTSCSRFCRNTCCYNNYIPVPGPQGPEGQSATIAIGTTTTLPAGENASVTNSGTLNNAILNFAIPQGKDHTQLNSGNFISRNSSTYTTPTSIITLPITLNNTGININSNSVINIPKSGRYLINYGISSLTSNNIIGLYINGINNQNTNIRTKENSSINSSLILDLKQNDTLTLNAISVSQESPLILEENTINAYITMQSID